MSKKDDKLKKELNALVRIIMYILCIILGMMIG